MIIFTQLFYTLDNFYIAFMWDYLFRDAFFFNHKMKISFKMVEKTFSTLHYKPDFFIC